MLYLIIAASTKPGNLVLFSTVYLFPPSLLAVFVSLVSPSLLLRLIPTFSLFSLSLPKARAFGSVDGELTEEMMDNGVEEMVEQHQQKVFWEKGSS